jgi:hypothetical protein
MTDFELILGKLYFGTERPQLDIERNIHIYINQYIFHVSLIIATRSIVCDNPSAPPSATNESNAE